MNGNPSASSQGDAGPAELAQNADNIDIARLLAPLRRRKITLLAAFVAAGIVGYGVSYLVTPRFTSTTTFLPPQQQQSSVASALSSLNSLAGLAGAGGLKSPAEQYVSLMQSVTVADHIVDRFKLMEVYDKKYRLNARKTLAQWTSMVIGKRDGLISVSVTDSDTRRAADMANQYVEELRRMTSVLAVSEAQQRRVFFEKQMQESKGRLVAAQTALQQSGITAGAVKAEPQAAARQYAELRAQAMAAEVRLQTLRTTLTDTAPEVKRQLALLEALHAQIEQVEASTTPESSAPDYVSKFREFKYQETLFDIMSKQYELARVDESREGALIQVVDPAMPAELKSSPRRIVFAGLGSLLGLIAAALFFVVRGARTRDGG